MGEYKFLRAQSLFEGGSNVNNNWGYNPRVATRKYFFINTNTKETFSVTDLILQKQRRNRVLVKMRETYSRLIVGKKISTLIIVAPVDYYEKPVDFLKGFKKKLITNDISLLGYYWQRDIGDGEFKRHYHFIFFLKKIDGVIFKKLFKSKKDAKYEAEFCDSLSNFKGYLKKKELYAPEKKRSYGCSRVFKKP
jgi:hypothetical protein